MNLVSLNLYIDNNLIIEKKALLFLNLEFNISVTKLCYRKVGIILVLSCFSVQTKFFLTKTKDGKHFLEKKSGCKNLNLNSTF